MKRDRFYLACLRDTVGGNMAFHGKSGSGYPTDTKKAEVYSLADAQRAWDSGRHFDQPVSADHVDALLVPKVDCQRLPYETCIDPNVHEWLAFKRGSWDGNYVYWRTEGGSSLDVTEAITYTLTEVKADDPRWVFVPKALALSNISMTFAVRHFNPRTMVQAAGLLKPKSLKLQARRKNNPKTRMNCDHCGKIHWQYNPHDFEGCNDPNCKGYKGDPRLRTTRY